MLLYYGHNLLFCKFGILFDNFYSSYLIIYNGFSIFIYVTINPSIKNFTHLYTLMYQPNFSGLIHIQRYVN